MNRNENASLEPKFCVRAKFYAIRQTYGEPVTTWYTRVREAAVPCGFGRRRLELSVADKFVTGLWPGPVADRMYSESADRPPEDLLAVAVAVERRTLGRRDSHRGGKNAMLLTEVRETLKLYRFQGERYAAVRDLDDDGGGDRRNDFNHVSLVQSYGDNTISNNAIPMQDEEPCSQEKTDRNSELKSIYSSLTCRSCYDLATKLLESFQIKNQTRREFNKSENSETRVACTNYCHRDESNCNCSLF